MIIIIIIFIITSEANVVISHVLILLCSDG